MYIAPTAGKFVNGVRLIDGRTRMRMPANRAKIAAKRERPNGGAGNAVISVNYA